jgi:hypothetical protein
MTYDIEAMRRMVDRLFTYVIVERYGRIGGERLRDVLEAVRTVYRYRPAETFADGLVIFAALDSAQRPHNPDASRSVDPYAVAATTGPAAIQVLPNRQLLWWDELPSDLQRLGEVAVVYVNGPQGEAFALPDGLEAIDNPQGYPSALAPPSFFTLEEALRYYDSQQARRSTCKILMTVWHDETRLLLKRKPEATMRQSLAQYLRVALRDHAEVFEEQNVSETEPVDIKITYAQSEHRALIEIKWLGKSVNRTGDGIGTGYSADGRTNEGAQQLGDYLDDHAQRSPATRTIGHLVVYDARRAGVTTYPPAPTAEQAWQYEPLHFAVPPQTQREDFADPSRFFLEPAVPKP